MEEAAAASPSRRQRARWRTASRSRRASSSVRCQALNQRSAAQWWTRGAVSAATLRTQGGEARLTFIARRGSRLRGGLGDLEPRLSTAQRETRDGEGGVRARLLVHAPHPLGQRVARRGASFRSHLGRWCCAGAIFSLPTRWRPSECPSSRPWCWRAARAAGSIRSPKVCPRRSSTSLAGWCREGSEGSRAPRPPQRR